MTPYLVINNVESEYNVMLIQFDSRATFCASSLPPQQLHIYVKLTEFNMT